MCVAAEYNWFNVSATNPTAAAFSRDQLNAHQMSCFEHTYVTNKLPHELNLLLCTLPSRMAHRHALSIANSSKSTHLKKLSQLVISLAVIQVLNVQVTLCKLVLLIPLVLQHDVLSDNANLCCQ